MTTLETLEAEQVKYYCRREIAFHHGDLQAYKEAHAKIAELEEQIKEMRRR